MPRGRPRKKIEEKSEVTPEEKTLGEIKDTIKEGNKTREVLESFTEEVAQKPKKSYKIELLMFLGCVIILALGALERGRVIEVVGAIGLIITLIMTLIKYYM